MRSLPHGWLSAQNEVSLRSDSNLDNLGLSDNGDIVGGPNDVQFRGHVLQSDGQF